MEGIQNIRLRHLNACNGFLSRVRQGMDTAARQKNLTLPVSSTVDARGLHALIDGLIQNWLLEPESFDLPKTGQCTMDIYFKGLGFSIE